VAARLTAIGGASEVFTGAVVSYADGERFGPLPITVECAPGALSILV